MATRSDLTPAFVAAFARLQEVGIFEEFDAAVRVDPEYAVAIAQGAMRLRARMNP